MMMYHSSSLMWSISRYVLPIPFAAENGEGKEPQSDRTVDFSLPKVLLFFVLGLGG